MWKRAHRHQIVGLSLPNDFFHIQDSSSGTAPSARGGILNMDKIMIVPVPVKNMGKSESHELLKADDITTRKQSMTKPCTYSVEYMGQTTYEKWIVCELFELVRVQWVYQHKAHPTYLASLEKYRGCISFVEGGECRNAFYHITATNRDCWWCH